MIFSEDKLKLIKAMLEAAWDAAPSLAAKGEESAAHWRATATAVVAVVDYGEEGKCDESCPRSAAI